MEELKILGSKSVTSRRVQGEVTIQETSPVIYGYTLQFGNAEEGKSRSI
jgi:hypothetical protein